MASSMFAQTAINQHRGDLPMAIGELSAQRVASDWAARLQLAPPPAAPESVAQTGLNEVVIADLLLKHLLQQGVLSGYELARAMCLPFSVIEPLLEWLKHDRYVEVTGGEMLGPISYRFALTDLGRQRAREAMDACQYVGPTPVTLLQYAEQMQRQSVRGIPCTEQEIRRATAHLLLPDELFDGLGPAVVSGHSILLYGPPGSGKSAVSRALGEFLNRRGGLIWVPYAIYEAGSIITLYDPLLHTQLSERESGADPELLAVEQYGVEPDPRWVCVYRPVVSVGGELTLAMLDLSYNATGNYYQPPIQLKANGGLLVIDDFGRQVVSPQALLNRWILPLEERYDYLTLANGKKIRIPFEQLVIFSTNLDPNDLADEAFLRRIRYKLSFRAPSRAEYEQIFRLTAERLGLEFEEGVFDHLFAEFYVRGKRPRGSDPRDLLEIATAICRFRGIEPPRVTVALIHEAASRFFSNEVPPAEEGAEKAGTAQA